MRFLGNKTRMLENIKSVIESNNITGNIFCDLLKFKLVNTFAEQSIKYPYIMV